MLARGHAAPIEAQFVFAITADLILKAITASRLESAVDEDAEKVRVGGERIGEARDDGIGRVLVETDALRRKRNGERLRGRGGSDGPRQDSGAIGKHP